MFDKRYIIKGRGEKESIQIWLLHLADALKNAETHKRRWYRPCELARARRLVTRLIRLTGARHIDQPLNKNYNN